jgi:Secretion system C-terminal sorting domain
LVIERSYTNANYTTVKRINTAVNTVTSFTDINTAGRVYYRLQIVLQNGEKYYSRILSFNTEKKVPVKIIPNPVKEIFTVEFTCRQNQYVNFVVTDINGKIVLNHLRYVTGGMQTQTFSANSLLPGFYFLKLYADDKVVAEKFIRQ